MLLVLSGAMGRTGASHHGIQIDQLHKSLCNFCVSCSAYKNKGVQSLLDGVTNYLPSPLDVVNTALDVNKDQAPLSLPSSPHVGLLL